MQEIVSASKRIDSIKFGMEDFALDAGIVLTSNTQHALGYMRL